RKPLILAGHFCFTLAVLVLFISYHWTTVFIAIILIAFGMSAFWPCLFAFLADFTPKNFGKSNGRIFQFWDIGIIISSIIAKTLLDFLLLDLRDLFMIVGSMSLISFLISAIILPESLTSGRRKVDSILGAFFHSITQMFSSLVLVSRMKDMIEIYLFQFVLAFLGFMMMTFFPVLVVDRCYSKGTVSEIYFWSTLMLIWFKPRFGILTDKVNFSLLMVILLEVASGAIILITLSTELWMMIVFYIIFFGCNMTAYVATNGETSRRAPSSYHGLALGALGIYVSTGRAISTAILGPVWDYNLNAVFLLTAAGVTIAALIIFFFFRKWRNENESIIHEYHN
ncbi:MAG: MFS transporter, partial [Candidatus Hodarchaeales archaeon]